MQGFANVLQLHLLNTLVSRNSNMAMLQAGYLFPEIAKRRAAHLVKYPDAQVISLGIGDTTEPIPDIITSMAKKVRYAIASSFYGSLDIEEGDIFVSPELSVTSRLQMLFGSDISIAVQDPSYPVAIETASFSKYAGFTGVRLGWTVGPKALT
ncbi:LL-diaminopimelate aminotransferase, chloroplastic-like isoform X2 [Beta vulgaris subsp. vulgaris]|uniref:LL-diaminopimelate aminotransferase, chloroplastic-like isoform X2 n=1 Tax=Beta vulgaris subsp. vulgaris TaxID=3555 RepID=UPI002037252E|nr:LL-diaminopimelate aminotransferase, chloroplastic-like isoform X2 [Beta vulgaris subsp. vulgaris]XP_048493620.1 LL-diaminopimelate aminotransferase, chloroplastic-like isoform X2 [Beta vulgaris subsp. vulgaris]